MTERDEKTAMIEAVLNSTLPATPSYSFRFPYIPRLEHDPQKGTGHESEETRLKHSPHGGLNQATKVPVCGVDETRKLRNAPIE